MAANKSGVEVIIVDHGYDDVMKQIKKLNGSYTGVGYFGHGGTPSDDVAARAWVLEKGATIRVTAKMRGYLAAVLGIFLKRSTHVIRIPARPFMAKTRSLYKRKLEERKIIEFNRLLDGKSTAKQLLSRLGEYWVGRIKYVMTNVRFTPNSPVTIRQKGSSKPLISSGQLRNSTDHREVMK